MEVWKVWIRGNGEKEGERKRERFETFSINDGAGGLADLLAEVTMHPFDTASLLSSSSLSFIVGCHRCQCCCHRSLCYSLVFKLVYMTL